MTNNRQAKRTLRRLKYVKTWQLFVLLLLSLLLLATFLRLNNIGMAERRAAVLSADEAGNEEAIVNNLYALQRHAAAHMNASSGVIYLEGSYKRETERLVEVAKNSSTVNSEAFAKADETCRAQFPGYSQAYTQCNASEQAKYAGSSNFQSVVFPNPELYRHEYVSPLWSPDFAGFSFLLSATITGVIIVRFIMLGILQLLLRKHYTDV